jgi:two-component sensor histidine kinase
MKEISHKEFFSVILNKAFDGILYLAPVADSEGIIEDFTFLFVNETAVKNLNIPEEDYYRKTFLELFPNAKENGTFYMYKAAIEKGKSSRELVYYEDELNKGWFRVDSFKYEEGVIVYFRDDTLNIMNQMEIHHQNVSLQKLLKEKEILLKETHHRIKNNLQMITGLLNLQSRTIKDSAVLDAFGIAVQRIQTISLIHEKLYKENNYHQINFGSFITDIMDSVREFHVFDKDIKFTLKTDHINLDITTCINLGLILNELFSNSIKHGFKGKGEKNISVEAEVKDKTLNLIVKDNGKGLPDNLVLNELDTLGLTIVRLLVDQMSGTLVNYNRSGAIFEISIPV